MVVGLGVVVGLVAVVVVQSWQHWWSEPPASNRVWNKIERKNNTTRATLAVELADNAKRPGMAIAPCE